MTGAHLSILAIDGGGTRCRLALDDGTRVVTVETGAANVSTDMGGALAQIEAGLAALAGAAGVTPESLADHPAHVGLAGVTGPEIAAQVRARLPLTRAHVTSDLPAALRGALGPRDGALAHCGTGSFCASRIGGEIRAVGGWGHVLGDEASAQWIAKVALRLTLEAVDGRRATTPLARGLLDMLEGATGIVRFAGTARPEAFGALARQVTARAAEGDAMAREVMAAGAAEIARALPHVGWVTGMPLCLAGGIGPEFAPFLPDAMRAALVAPEGSPLDGARALARDFAREGAA